MPKDICAASRQRKNGACRVSLSELRHIDDQNCEFASKRRLPECLYKNCCSAFARRSRIGRRESEDTVSQIRWLTEPAALA
jgi:hypothetical protein